MAVSVVEYVHAALDRNETPNVVRISRSNDITLKESENILKNILKEENDVHGIEIVIKTDINPETNSIEGKKISLNYTKSNKPENIYGIYRSNKNNEDGKSIDNSIRNSIWFPRIEEGLNGNPIVFSDVINEKIYEYRNIQQKAAEATSLFTNSKQQIKKINPPLKSTQFFQSTSSKSTKPKSKPQQIIENDDSDQDDDVPKFVKKNSQHKRLRVCDDSSEDEADLLLKKPSIPSITTSTIETTTKELNPSLIMNSNEKKTNEINKKINKKLIVKTYINEEGYMVTENTYEDIEENENDMISIEKSNKNQKSNLKLLQPLKKKRIIKSKNNTIKQSNLMDFFNKK